MTKPKTLSVESLTGDSRSLYDGLQDERDIACVLISTSYLDNCMASLLGRYFAKTSVSGKLLDPRRGLLGAYSARADLCYCLGLVAKEVYQNLQAIAQIRNQFAHSHLSVTFDDPEVRQWCLDLISPPFFPCPVDDDGSDPDVPDLCRDPRGKFTVVVSLTVQRLILTAMDTTHCPSKDDWWS